MTSSKQKPIIFPPFRLDCAEQRLYRDKLVIPLRPKAFEVLRYLLERPGKLVTKDQVLEAVWSETMVTDTVLKVCIREIREALADDPASPKFIETAHRRGYRFIAPVKESYPEEAEQEQIASPAESSGINAAQAQSHLAASRSSEVVGREGEITRLEAYLAKALEGWRQLIFVTGEPGIGKTTLVQAFLQRAGAGKDMLSARGQCLEQYGAAEAYLPMLEAVSRLCREPGSEPIIAGLRKHAPTWLAQIPWLISEPEREALQRETLGATRERMLREMAEAIETLTRSQPLVLVIEDLHWSDYSTVDLLSYLARRSEPARLMIIGTYRPAEVISARHPLNAVKRELQAHRQCEELALQFLNEGAVVEYLAARYPGNRFPPKLPQSIHQRTDGNPLFILNLLDYLQTKGLIAQLGGEWRLLEAVEKVETVIPDNIRQIIEKQVDSLSKQERRVLETASIAGVEFSIATIAAALDADMIEAEETCENLARRHLFLRSAGSNELPDGEWSAGYGFIHALYQNVLYDLVPVARRAHLHKRIAEHTEVITGSRAGEMAAELAMHFEKARDYRRAALYLQQAAENASHRSASQEARELSRRGLALLARLPDTPERAQPELLLQTSLAVALSVTEGYGATEVEQAYSRARELCQQVGGQHLSPVLWGLWRFYLIRSDLKAAREMSQHLLDLAQSGQDAALRVEAHLAAGTTCDNIGEFASARTHFEQGMSLYDSKQRQLHLSLYGHDPKVVLRCFNAWAIWALGYPNLALETAREAVAFAEELRHPETLCFALFFAAWVHQLRRESEETLKYAQLTIEIASRNAIAQWIAFGSSLQGWALAEQGNISEGITQMRETLATYRAIGSEISRPHFLALFAEALLKNGEIEEGLLALDEALAMAEHTDQRYYESELYRLKGELCLAHGGNLEQVEDCFQRAIEVARTQQALSFELRAATSLSRLWQRDNRREAAQLLLAEVYNRFTEGFDAPDLLAARLLLGA